MPSPLLHTARPKLETLSLNGIVTARFDTQRLRKTWACPYATPPWPDSDGFSMRLVKRCLDSQTLNDTPWNPDDPRLPDNLSPARHHAARVAWFVRNGWHDLPCFHFSNTWGTWPILDGNHRFAAAIFARDTDILVSVDGWLDIAENLALPGTLQDHEDTHLAP